MEQLASKPKCCMPFAQVMRLAQSKHLQSESNRERENRVSKEESDRDELSTD